MPSSRKKAKFNTTTILKELDPMRDPVNVSDGNASGSDNEVDIDPDSCSELGSDPNDSGSELTSTRPVWPDPNPDSDPDSEGDYSDGESNKNQFILNWPRK